VTAIVIGMVLVVIVALFSEEEDEVNRLSQKDPNEGSLDDLLH
jgi:hypothetical protein